MARSQDVEVSLRRVGEKGYRQRYLEPGLGIGNMDRWIGGDGEDVRGWGKTRDGKLGGIVKHYIDGENQQPRSLTIPRHPFFPFFHLFFYLRVDRSMGTRCDKASIG